MVVVILPSSDEEGVSRRQTEGEIAYSAYFISFCLSSLIAPMGKQQMRSAVSP